MPKIQAPTVEEHREIMTAKLVDAAEELLRREGPASLSAGAVAVKAGMARNSIYRYVRSVDELRLLVLQKNIPLWRKEVMKSVRQDSTPAEMLTDVVVACIRQSAEGSSHGWLMGLMKPGKKERNPHTEETTAHQVNSVHHFFDEFLLTCWKDVGAAHPDVWASFTKSIIYNAFGLLEKGESSETVCRVAREAMERLTSNQGE